MLTSRQESISKVRFALNPKKKAVIPATLKAKPALKITGKDFKGCVILDAVVENDGRHIINMPPVPRVGKWYLHIIGRDNDGNLRPSISASLRIELHK